MKRRSFFDLNSAALRNGAGVGRFDGVLLAFDLRDLPPEPMA